MINALTVLERKPASLSASSEESRRAAAATRLFVRYVRPPLIASIHLLLFVASSYLAFWLRFDGAIPAAQQTALAQALPWLVAVRAATFVAFRLHKGLWRYTGLWELQRIVSAAAISAAVTHALIHGWLQLGAYPRTITIVDTLILIVLLGAVRLSVRLAAQLFAARGQRRVLVVGAGDAGETIVRDMLRRQIHEPIGFVDDDRSKVGQRIHGIPVLGTRADLPELLTNHCPQEVLLAVPSAPPSMVQEVVQALRPFRVRLTTLPSRGDISNGLPATQIRDLSIEDLLTRAPVGLDERMLTRLIEGRRVMVTGAGGSIGSELCRQIAALHPASLVLFERYENNLFAIGNDLVDRGASSFIHLVVGDVTDVQRVDAIMTEHRPEIVFHAAAHKHVPLMEHNPCEAIKNNVAGTRLIAEAAERHGVSRFIFISSDKAVNPTSVMGATKRVAELILQTHIDTATRFSTVRFGNVLGSNGSVVPRFLQQIREGGPVTITHPDIRRYFMLIPEAVHLVLHAAAQKTPGMVYVLEMGEQIKLVDLARNLIRLAGFVPDEEIPITYVGLRPGEKLYEELVGPNEDVRKSSVEKVLQVSPRNLPNPEQLMHHVALLERLAHDGDAAAVIKQIGVIVAEFNMPEPQPAPQPARKRVMAPSTPAPDFRSLDLVFRSQSTVIRRPFAPQDLR
jgi:FlaA1/EpsC-like NDP-sugar epimerase